MEKPGSHASKQEVEQFYDSYTSQQNKIGVNIRHRTIFRNLKALGLKPDSKVLEVGCGIGTVSSLIIKVITQGRFLGVDISPGSIQQAQRTFASHNHAEFMVNDMRSFQSSVKFDFVVLPDVLEHIPVEQHSDLFKTLASATTPDAVVLINIPEPNCLNWIRKHHPEKLQIIDQSLSMQDLLNNCYPHGFKLASMNSYGLQYEEPEYTCIVLKKNMELKEYHRKGTLQRGLENTLSKIR